MFVSVVYYNHSKGITDRPKAGKEIENVVHSSYKLHSKRQRNRIHP